MSTITKKLGIKQRLLIGSLLPARGCIMDLRILTELELKLSLSEAEQKKYGVMHAVTAVQGPTGLINKVLGGGALTEQEAKQIEKIGTGGPTLWDSKAEQGKRITFCERAIEIIADKLRELDKQGQLHKDYMDIWDWFVTEDKDTQPKKK